MWIHGNSARLYVSVAIMVLLYNAAWFHRQVKGSMYHCESRGDGPPASVMHFVVLYCWHVFGYAVFLLCNNAATGNDDCRRNKRGISGATIFRTKIQIKSINKMLKKNQQTKKSLFGASEDGGRSSFPSRPSPGHFSWHSAINQIKFLKCFFFQQQQQQQQKKWQQQ